MAARKKHGKAGIGRRARRAIAQRRAHQQDGAAPQVERQDAGNPAKELPQADKRDLAAQLRKVAERLEKHADNEAVTVFASRALSGGQQEMVDVTAYADYFADKGTQSVPGLQAPLEELITIRIESSGRPSRA